jgi:hypothetical protein
MADSQFITVEPLSNLRLRELADVRQNVSELTAWLSGVHWRVSSSVQLNVKMLTS